jgi:8-oxo-dGTP diphosphatase
VDFRFSAENATTPEASVDMKARTKIRAPIQAAGGIVVRDRPTPLIAIVQLRKDKAWVLPKGKLKPNEDALAAAEREVLEETGHRVSVHEFLGAMSHADGNKLKIVQFWRMRAAGGRQRKLMRDIKAVQWLPLDRAIETLSHAHERAFLANVGPIALEAAARSAPELVVDRGEPSPQAEAGERPADASLLSTVRAWVSTFWAWLRRVMPGTA